MQEILHDPEPVPKKKFSPITALMAVVVMAAIMVSLWFVLGGAVEKPKPVAQVAQPTTMSPAEVAYLKNIHIENIALSRAENFIHQEVTILNADAVNGGSEAAQLLSVTVEFSDEMNQVVLRDTRQVLGSSAPVLGPGQSRTFEISFDRVPGSWNMQQPVVKASFVQFAPGK